MRKFTFLLLFFLWGLPLDAGNDGDALMDDLRFLAAPAREGRATGSAGCQSATFFLLREFKGAGLETTVQSFECGGKAGHNVIGRTPGWFRRYIVVGAYYDGIGRFGEDFYPGADSNASGVAAMLSLARSLSGLCRGDTGLIFVAFDAHNAGLLGSKEFLASIVGRFNVSLMVNIDIIGSSQAPLRESRPDYMIALGGVSHMFSIEKANRGIGLDLGYDYYGSATFTDLFYRKVSDQRWFLESGIPSVMFTSGITMNTNKTTDTVDGLDIPVMMKRIALIDRWLAGQI